MGDVIIYKVRLTSVLVSFVKIFLIRPVKMMNHSHLDCLGQSSLSLLTRKLSFESSSHPEGFYVQN